MAHWEYKLRLKDIWHDEDMPFEEKRDEIVRRINASRFWTEDDYHLTCAVDGLESAVDLDDFDDAWNDFYDWADDVRVWVETF